MWEKGSTRHAPICVQRSNYQSPHTAMDGLLGEILRQQVCTEDASHAGTIGKNTITPTATGALRIDADALQPCGISAWCGTQRYR